RTPLTGILALGELLATSELNERERRWVAALKGTAEHLASLTTLVVDGAKAEAKGLVLREEAFDLARLVRTSAGLFTARAEAKGLTCRIEVADDLPARVIGDPVRLRTVVENLLDNAVKFTDRGEVALRASTQRAAGGRVRLKIDVTDSGIGLKPAEIKRLFRPFEQASVEIQQRYGGAGLGLVLVKRLARLMGGDLTVESEPGRGSTFRFAALMKALATAAPDERTDAAGAGPASQPARPLRILCVEDNPYGRVVMNTILSELGHRVDFVGSGEAAVETVARGGHDVVLMDVKLAGLDGLEATRRVRRLAGNAAQVPIVGISGRTETGDEQAAREAGMDAYLRKPVSPGALARTLETVSARAPERKPQGGLPDT
ncbi:MAG TPA: ATP-binding protein, partial [Xanthobacteraceae bacterium]|nr:ATP-binding protein [Xanthobacteraceae bacterium]